MKRKNVIRVLCVMAMSALLLAGCGNASADATGENVQETTVMQDTANEQEVLSAEDEATAETGQPPQMEKEALPEGAKMVMVTAIDGDTITGNAMAGGGMKGGNRPQGEAPGGEMPQGEKPQGEMPLGEKPEGEKPEGEAPGGEMPQGEAISFIITDTTEITKQDGEETVAATKEDITVDSMLIVTLDDNNNAVSIVISNMDRGERPDKPTDAPTAE